MPSNSTTAVLQILLLILLQVGVSVHDAAAWYSMFACIYGVRYFFSDAACAGSIAGFDTLGTAGAECIAVLSYVVP